jgi:nucleoid-associated protein Lsr2
LFDRYIKAVRRSSPAGGRRRPSRKAAASTKGSKPKREFDIAQLREWAGATNVTVPARGRIPRAVVDQYKQAGDR